MIRTKHSLHDAGAIFAVTFAAAIVIANSVSATALGAIPVSFFQVEPVANRQAPDPVVNGSFADWKDGQQMK